MLKRFFKKGVSERKELPTLGSTKKIKTSAVTNSVKTEKTDLEKKVVELVVSNKEESLLEPSEIVVSSVKKYAAAEHEELQKKSSAVVVDISAGQKGDDLKIPEHMESKLFFNKKERVLYCSEDDYYIIEFQSIVASAQRKDIKVEALPLPEISKMRSLVFETKSKAQDSASIIKAGKMIADAAKKNASDIHILIGDNNHTTVRFRVHGLATFHKTWTKEEGEALGSTIYQAMCDISDPTYIAGIPQDGRMSNRNFLPDDIHAVRVATSPTDYGSLMVLRLLNKDNLSGNIEKFGYHPQQVKAFKEISSKISGIVLVTGPTGSGKSSTLKCCLENKYTDFNAEINILTVEDPPEYPIKGANQTMVTNADTTEKRKEAFNTQIRAALRLDPDVLMVGEIRDLVSAELAFEGALTGHQVWSTLHTNSAIEAFERLIQMGVDPKMLKNASLINGVCFQRLVRVLCSSCKIKVEDHKNSLNEEELKILKSLGTLIPHNDNVYMAKAGGCPDCDGLGVSGRQAVAEVFKGDVDVQALISEGKVEEAKAMWKAMPQTVTYEQHATMLVYVGKVSPFDAMRAINYFEDIHHHCKNGNADI
jgi:general secretion pathway protein E